MYRQEYLSVSPYDERRDDQNSWRKNDRMSFICHLRPRHYLAGSLHFSNTFYLGFFTTLFFAIEGVTGFLLMLYYSPTPTAAYQSILGLAAVPFGQTLRDLHRLVGDLLVLTAFLHLLRVMVGGAYKGPRRHTWLTGMVLFLLIIALAFSGYLLPWDQLSYWAVTVGTSLFGALPAIGPWLLEILRGGAEMGADGLLRFYVLHVVILPVVTLLFLAIHYYRVARLHGISLPVCTTARRNSEDYQQVPLWPTVLGRELQLTLITIFVLLAFTAFCYDAPLASPANPLHTPSHIVAPWFFIWGQELLGIFPSTLLGLAFLGFFLLLIFLLPWYDRGQRRPLRERPRLALILTLSLLFLGLLTFYGVRGPQSESSSPETMFDGLVGEDGHGPLLSLGYDDLTLGVYRLGLIPADKELSPGLDRLFALVGTQMKKERDGGHSLDITAVIIIEQIQDKVKRIILRQTGNMSDSPIPRTYERMIYRHGFTEKEIVTAVEEK